MTKAKYFILIFMVVALTLMIPNISNAARETYTDNAQGVTWSYEIDENGDVINLALDTTDAQGKITIPSTIDDRTVISLKAGSVGYGGGAFQECEQLTEVIIPSSIIKLSNYCFGDCTNLKSIEIPDSVTSIGSYCFNNCDALTSITIPSTVTTIGDNAFWGCDNLTSVTIENQATSVGSGVFWSCKRLTTVNLPSSITEIPENFFYGCESLESIALPANITSIGGAAFIGCTSLTSIDIPAKVTSIGGNAFNGCTSLTSITIPDSVTEIGVRAFEGCTSLKSIELSENITTLVGQVFEGCTALTSIIIPNSVTTIYEESETFEGTFKGCTDLQKILIPDSVTIINEGAFEGCSNLTIYSNKDSAAYNFAVANNIPWLPIEDWDKQTSGTDLTRPTVESIEVPLVDYILENENKESKLYILVSGKKVTIEVKFNENIKATTLPALTIKFGEGNNIKLTNGVISENKITYEYTIKDTDKGVLATVDFSGGDIKDEAGNVAELTCPALKKLYNDYSLYANGEVVDNGTENDGTAEGSGNQNATDSENEKTEGTGTTDNKEENKIDSTTSTEKLPQTGVGIGAIISVIVLSAICIVAYCNYRKFKCL